jgi:uncharacterized membrane-anchored protein
MNPRSEEMLVGLVALFAAGYVGHLITRAMRSGKFVFPRWRIDRGLEPAKFRALLAAYGVALLLMGLISADLLLGLDLRSAA